MSPEQARELMHDALDGELDEAQKQAFERALADDASLRAEYDDLSRVLQETRALTREPTGSVDLLSGVQQRLRERSGGRFYRDRFAEASGRTPNVIWMLALALVVVIAISAWLAFDAGLFLKTEP